MVNLFKNASLKTGSLKLHTPYILLMSYLTAIIALLMRDNVYGYHNDAAPNLRFVSG